jgi:lipoprotein-releasing system permease protein
LGARGLTGSDDLARRLEAVPGVRAATPFVLQQALFSSPAGGAHGGLVRGVDLSSPPMLAGIKGQLRRGSVDPLIAGEPAILLGIELARTLGVVAGDSVTLTPPSAITVGMVPKMALPLAGTIEIGMHEFETSVAYLSLPAAQEFAGLPDGVSGIEVKLADPFAAKSVGRAVAAALGPGFWVRDWMDLNRNLFAALQLEKLALFVIVTIIVLVAAFAIIGHLVLLVAEKRKEIGILKAIGASRASITTVFFVIGMSIGLLGTISGSLVGLALIWAQNTFKIIRLAGDVYQIDYLPMKLTLGDFALVVGATFLLSLLATIFPARRAGALAPVDVLRYE